MSIRKCNCQNIYQDNRYGKGMRVKNGCGTQTTPGFRCTVCGNTESIGWTGKKGKK